MPNAISVRIHATIPSQQRITGIATSVRVNSVIGFVEILHYRDAGGNDNKADGSHG
jgi:hypothetical protein